MLARPLTIRQASGADAPALRRIYAPFVESTAVSFETVVPSVEEFAGRIGKSLSRWQYLVAERDGEIAGYAYGGTHRERAAYRYSVEVSAYLDPRFHRQGIGSALYRQLLDDLAALGYCTAFAGITVPNEASIGLHASVGFEPIGVFRRIGWKFDRWHDVAWMQKTLRDRPPDPTRDP
jgi:L-amino acid N-acyltransferase YncA